MIIPIRRPPTWPLRLSNAELLAEFERALDGRRVPALNLRLELLDDEICRRAQTGTWTDDDWKDAPQPSPDHAS